MKQTRTFDRLDLLLSAALGLLSLTLYVRTLVPWLLPGDSGEFQVLAHQVGIAHTTGYPVYILLGKLFITLAPVGDVAYRVNLFSAFMAAVTVALVYAAGKLAARSRWGGLFASLALTVSFTVSVQPMPKCKHPERSGASFAERSRRTRPLAMPAPPPSTTSGTQRRTPLRMLR